MSLIKLLLLLLLSFSFSSSPSLSSRSSSSSKGSYWTWQLHYYTIENGYTKEYQTYYHDQLREMIESMANEIDADDRILESRLYIESLGGPIFIGKIVHMFVIVKTAEGWYYTFEKIRQGIYVQRSKNQYYVLYYFTGDDRKEFELESEYSGSQKTIRDVFKWIWRNEELRNQYHVRRSNCQHFAKSLYYYI